jgi:membrane dipeptidase
MKVNFAPYFIAPPGKANVQAVADHVEHIANIAGKRQLVTPTLAHSALLNPLFSSVGIGSDFDGILETPRGLEDVSKYPSLVSCLTSSRHVKPLMHDYSDRRTL